MKRRIHESKGRYAFCFSGVLLAVLSSPLTLAAQAVHGTGTTNTLPLWTNPSTIGSSSLTQSGSNLTASGGLTAASFTGDGSRLTNLDAAQLFHALIVQPSVTDSSFGQDFVSANVVAGYGAGTTINGANTIMAGVTGATISGGGGTLGGGGFARNSVTDDWGTVGGGFGNTAGDSDSTTYNSIAATVAGGQKNTAGCSYDTVGGGYQNTASGCASTVVGGYFNSASGFLSLVAGGQDNVASGAASFAAGFSAHAVNQSSFVWDGSWNGTNGTFTTLSSTADGQFLALAPGGVVFFSATDLSTGVALAPGGGSWSSVSDRNVKANLSPVNELELLESLSRIPITTWNYKSQQASIRHLGPMAQDFHAAFGLGEDDKHIDDIDGQGVALAGVQALYRLSLKEHRQIREQRAQMRNQQDQIRQLVRSNKEKDLLIRAMRGEIKQLRQGQTSLAELEMRLERLEARDRGTRHASAHPAARPNRIPRSEVARLGT